MNPFTRILVWALCRSSSGTAYQYGEVGKLTHFYYSKDCR